MTANDFRRTALALGDTLESSHMGHPDFRVYNRVFASLNAEQTVGTVKLTPDEQRDFIEQDTTVFEPAAGAWGLQGWTKVHLAAAAHETVGEALTLAWQRVHAQGPSRAKARTTRATAAKTATEPRGSGRQAASPRGAKATGATGRATRGGAPAARKAAPVTRRARASSSAPAQTSAVKTSATSKGAPSPVSGKTLAAANAARKVIDDYIAACVPSVQTILNKVRAMVRKEAPLALEKFSYRMPAFEMEGMLLYYAPFKNHLGIFPPVKGDAALAKALAPFRGDKGNLRFPFDAPMPYPLIRRVIQARLKEHAAHLAEKRAASTRRSAASVRSRTRG